MASHFVVQDVLRTHCVNQDDLLTHSKLPTCWEYRCEPPCQHWWLLIRRDTLWHSWKTALESEIVLCMSIAILNMLCIYSSTRFSSVELKIKWYWFSWAVAEVAQENEKQSFIEIGISILIIFYQPLYKCPLTLLWRLVISWTHWETA